MPDSPDPIAKRLSIRIVWQTKSGTPQAPVQLVAWKYPPRKENDQ